MNTTRPKKPHPLHAHRHLLGVLTDREVGDLCGLSAARVKTLRQNLGISRPRKASIVEPYRHLLGTMTDIDIAAMIGCRERTVASFRRVRGIVAFRTACAANGTPLSPRSKPKYRAPLTDRERWTHLLGTMPDAAVAEQVGCNPCTIRLWRIAAGIAPCRTWRATLKGESHGNTGSKRCGRKREPLSVTRWAKAWDDANDAPFMATDYADAIGKRVSVAVVGIERAVRRGEITEIDRHNVKRGVCGCYVVAA